ncbi:MAG: Malonyl CoA-acyl carrier protein transacylase [Fimbriimonadaceae bacterium]|nr:Malonyl CoA-acyl carrier protein transacylase [Fimbriimonadaceae bacterium]
MVAYIFPGQGSQRPGMGEDLVRNSAAASAVFDTVAAATGVDVRRLCFEASEDELRRTDNAQLALFTCGIAAFQAAMALGAPAPSITAGHSVGEYAALVAADVLTIEDGARAVQQRGKLMAGSGATRRGTMAAVLGLEVDAIEEVCAAVAGTGVVVIANDNCPGQIVISGDYDAVQAASAMLAEKGAKRVLPLNVSGAFHSPLMTESATAMGAVLRTIPFQKGRCPVVANVTAAPVEDPAAWPDLLERQLASSVRWTESVQRMRSLGVNWFVECGVGEVLCGLVKRIDRDAATTKVVDTATANEAVGMLGVPA